MAALRSLKSKPFPYAAGSGIAQSSPSGSSIRMLRRCITRWSAKTSSTLQQPPFAIHSVVRIGFVRDGLCQ